MFSVPDKKRRNAYFYFSIGGNLNFQIYIIFYNTYIYITLNTYFHLIVGEPSGRFNFRSISPGRHNFEEYKMLEPQNISNSRN